MNTIQIVPSRLSELHEKDLFRLLLKAYMSDIMGNGRIPDEKILNTSLKGVARHPTSKVYFAYYGTTCAGMAVCFETYATFMAKPALNIHDIIVLPNYRRLGIAREILNYIEADALANNIGKITLEVRSDNYPAHVLYRKQGFKECSPAMYFWIKTLPPQQNRR